MPTPGDRLMVNAEMKSLALVCLAIALGLTLPARYKAERLVKEATILVKAESKKVVRTHGKEYSPPNDPWGVALEWQFEPSRDVHRALVVSAGPDETMGTDDDIHHVATDYNKTGIITQWAGSKVKEGVKGFVRGMLNPAEHEDEK